VKNGIKLDNLLLFLFFRCGGETLIFQAFLGLPHKRETGVEPAAPTLARHPRQFQNRRKTLKNRHFTGFLGAKAVKVLATDYTILYRFSQETLQRLCKKLCKKLGTNHPF
jgi:hypothetical protein